MTQRHQPNPQRLFDLLADRAAGDISPADNAELEALLALQPPITDQQGRAIDPGNVDALAAALIAHWGRSDTAQLPPALRARLLASGESLVKSTPTVAGRIAPAGPAARPSPRALAGWLAAAAAVVVAAIGWLRTPPPVPAPLPPAPLSLAQQADALATQEPDTAVIPWKPLTDPLSEGVSGEVVWNTRLQKGFLRFRGLKVNDPGVEQYQLWMFDATRDADFPVDGGVFDVTAQGEVIIPMNPKLIVRDPAAIAVTVEQPGGVVVTKRERIVVIAPVKG